MRTCAAGRKPISWAHRYWYESLDLWGATDMQHVRNLMLSRPFLTRVPDSSIVVSDVGEGDGFVGATGDSRGRPPGRGETPDSRRRDVRR